MEKNWTLKMQPRPCVLFLKRKSKPEHITVCRAVAQSCPTQYDPMNSQTQYWNGELSLPPEASKQSIRQISAFRQFFTIRGTRGPLN